MAEPKTTPPAAGNGSAPAGAAVQGCPCCSRLTIDELKFSGNHPVEKDTTGAFTSPEWKAGRADSEQAPLAYTRKQKISVVATFKVTTPACKGPEAVQIKGTGTFGSATLEWTGTTTVSPGDTQATASMTSSQALPDAVDLFDASTITWTMNPCGCGWNNAGITKNTVYVTLGDPVGVNYWTLLDVSCTGAKGETTVAGVIAKSFDPLRSLAITRKRDGSGLTYWKPEKTCTATNTRLLLAATDGAGQCGSWAEFLIDMYKVHGIGTAHKIMIVRSMPYTNSGFLVKHWTFDHPPPSSATAFTHALGVNCKPATGAKGQRNDTPPPAFNNHFIVLADGKFWDPSYGDGPFADQQAWEKVSIDGIFDTTTKTSPIAGFDTSLNTGNNILEFHDLATNKKI